MACQIPFVVATGPTRHSSRPASRVSGGPLCVGGLLSFSLGIAGKRRCTSEKKMTATCACGQASITVNSRPTMLGVCHCTNCKRRTGSAFGISAYFEKTSVVSQRGETKTYTFWHKAQSNEQVRHFCSNCGTTLFWFVSTLPESIGVAGGCFAEQGLPEPTYSVTDRKREAWLSLPHNWKVWAD